MSRRSPRKRASIMCPRSFGRSNCEARVKRMAWTNTRQESDRPRRGAVSAASKRGPTTLEAFARSRTFKSSSPADPAAIRLRFFRATKRLRRLASAVAAAVATYFIAAPSPALATATPHPNASASHATQPKAYPPVAAAFRSRRRSQQKGSSRARQIDEAVEGGLLQPANLRQCAADVDSASRRQRASRALSRDLRLQSEDARYHASRLARLRRRRLGRSARRGQRDDGDGAQASRGGCGKRNKQNGRSSRRSIRSAASPTPRSYSGRDASAARLLKFLTYQLAGRADASRRAGRRDDSHHFDPDAARIHRARAARTHRVAYPRRVDTIPRRDARRAGASGAQRLLRRAQLSRARPRRGARRGPRVEAPKRSDVLHKGFDGHRGARLDAAFERTRFERIRLRSRTRRRHRRAV